jgi:hypothetical protein
LKHATKVITIDTLFNIYSIIIIIIIIIIKCMIIPVIIGATGIVTKGLKKNLEAVPGKHAIDSQRKTSILGTSYIIRKVLQSENRNLSGGNRRWYKRRSTGKIKGL